MKDRLENINCEAARIVTGATNLTTLNTHLYETGWEIKRQTDKPQAYYFP